MTDTTTITPAGIVVAAHVRHPLQLYEFKLYSLVASFNYPLPGIASISIDGHTCHRFISRVMPDLVDAGGRSLALHSEIGLSSTVRIGFVRRGGIAVLQAIQIVDLHNANPFAGFEP
jgi:hypothetical protein